jgi:hypothetical protein
MSRRPAGDSLPTITAAALEAQRTVGDRDSPLDPTIGKALAAESLARSRAQAWLKVCIGENGVVTGATPH